MKRENFIKRYLNEKYEIKFKEYMEQYEHVAFEPPEVIAKRCAERDMRCMKEKFYMVLLAIVCLAISIVVGTWGAIIFRDHMAEISKPLTIFNFIWHIAFYSAAVAFMSFIIIAIVSIVWDQISYSKDRGISYDSEGCTCRQSGNETCMYHYDLII